MCPSYIVAVDDTQLFLSATIHDEKVTFIFSVDLLLFMSPLEILALLVIVLGGIKILVISSNAKSWLKVVKTIYGAPHITLFVALVIGVVSLWILLQELSIVQIFASMLFFMSLMAIGFSLYSQEMIGLAEKILAKNNVLRRSWAMMLVWVVLVVWVVWEIFSN